MRPSSSSTSFAYSSESRQFGVRQSASRLNFIANILYILSTVIALYYVFSWLVVRPAFNVKNIEIRSTQADTLTHIVPSDVQVILDNQLDPYVFKIDLKHIQNKVLSMPWVRGVWVERVLPDKVRISIEEHIPLAYWNDQQMVNTEGEVFTPDRDYQNYTGLVHFYGPDKSHHTIRHYYKKMQSQLDQLNLKVVKIILTERFTWYIFLDNGVKLIMSKDQAVELSDGARLQDNYLSFDQMLARFIRVWPILKNSEDARHKIITEVDLRYMNGLSIREKDKPNTENREENESQR